MLDMTIEEYISIRKSTSVPLVTQIQRARSIAKTLGYYVAARYLARRSWSIEAACWILLKKECRIAR